MTVGYEHREQPTLRGLPYLGGKSAASPQGSGRWIAGLLPYRELYVEPFAGMLGVLLQRQPSLREIVNDLDGHITNWWTVLRVDTAELARRLELSPLRSRPLWKESRRILLEEAWEDDIDRAYRLAVVLTHAVNSQFAAGYRSDYGKARKALSPEYPSTERLYALARRMRRVQIDQKDAVELLDRLSDYSNGVFYCDPPYSSVGSLYDETVDFDALTEVLRRQKSLTAVSGYGNEWDHLDWPTRLERKSRIHLPNDRNQERVRVEVLWANGPLLEQGNLFDG